MVHRSSFPPVPCTPYSSYNCLPLTRRDLAYTYSCCRWAVQKHRWKYNLFHCFKPHVVVLAHLDNSVASWRWVLWPFVPWPFVSVAFCLVAFCLWPYVRWPFVPWPFVCTPGSHSFICKLHHTCLYLVSVHAYQLYVSNVAYIRYVKTRMLVTMLNARDRLRLIVAI